MNLAPVVKKLTQPMATAIRLMLRRGVLTLLNDDTTLQTLQVRIFADELADGLERFQQYGFTGVPLAGAEVLIAALGGDTSKAVIIAAENRDKRPKGMSTGEVALYTAEGDTIKLLNGRIVEINAGAQVVVNAPDVTINASTKVTLNTPQVNATGNLDVSGNVTVGGNNTVAGAIAATGPVSSGTSVADPTGTLADSRSKYNPHTHPNGGAPTPQM